MLTKASKFRATTAMTLDILATLGSFSLAVWLRIYGEDAFQYDLDEYGRLGLLMVPLWAASLEAVGTYERERKLGWPALSLRVFEALILANALLGLYAFYTRALFLSRVAMIIFFPTNFLAIMAGRALLALLWRRPVGRVLIVGTGDEAARVTDGVVGYLGVPGGAGVPPERILGETAELGRVLREHAPIDAVVVALPVEKLGSAEEVLRLCEERGLTVRVPVELSRSPEWRTSVDEIGGVTVLTMHAAPLDAGALALKRAVDIAGALVGLSFTGLLFPAVAAAIKLTSRGPVLFRQTRLGTNCRPFAMYKFRTMVQGAEEMKPRLRDSNVVDGPMFKLEHDPRVTPVGRVLRRISLDELPQFWNVLKGEMSLVGTRPPTADEVAEYGDAHFRRLTMKPGMTGLWQTSGRSRVTDFENIVRMDVEYIRNWSLWLDLKLLLKTVPAVILGRGAR